MTSRINANGISLIVLLLIVGHSYAQPAFFGTTYQGGEGGLGTIFTTDASGNNFQVIFEPKAAASYPSGMLLEVSSGVYYGLSAEGGLQGAGIIFEYNINTGVYTEKYEFDYDDGSGPLGSLTKASNGKLYGMTESGGVEGDGVVFEYDYINNVFVKKIDLKYSTIGSQPFTSFLEASNGKLYGLVSNGGTNASGAIIEYDPVTNNAVRKADLINSVNGRIPSGRLIEHNGKLYGTTLIGGLNNGGTLFEYDLTTSALVTLIDFKVDANSIGTPMIASNGKLYGVTTYSGAGSAGELYEYDFSNSMTTYLVQFEDFPLKSGVGQLTEISPGKLIGKCEEGGSNGYGGIFEYDLNTSSFVVKASFESKSGGSYESLIVGSDGKMYGLNPYGGTASYGVLYEFEPSTSTLNEFYNFNIIEEGYNPTSLVLSSSGKLYGVNNRGGVYDGGTLFEMNPLTYEITPLVQFKPVVTTSARVSQIANNYSSPHFLMEASNGKLYGRTNKGGGNYGVIFEYDPVTDALAKKLEFDSNTGYNASSIRGGGLLEVSGKLYGVTRVSGPSGRGALFEYDMASSSITSTADFDVVGISEPTSNLILAANGKLYGTSTIGGLNNKGTIFEYNIATETITKKIDFASVSGVNSFGGLLAASDDRLLGLTYGGGTNNEGEVFKYTPSTNTYTTLTSFDAAITGYPVGDLFAATSGKFYGLSGDSFFEFDGTTNLISKKHEFLNGAGSRFYPSNLVESCTIPLFDQPDDMRQCANTSFSITITSSNTDSYIWKRDGVVLNGQTSNELTIVDAKADDAGEYTCELINACGTSIMSTTVVIDELIVNANFDGNGVNIETNGGTAPYQYSSNGTDFQPENLFLLANGQYTFKVRDANNCEGSTTQSLVITSLDNGVEDISISAFPNPATNTITLSGVSGKLNIRLLDVTGKVVVEKLQINPENEIPVHFLKPGYYILDVTTVKGQRATFRLVKN